MKKMMISLIVLLASAQLYAMGSDRFRRSTGRPGDSPFNCCGNRFEFDKADPRTYHEQYHDWKNRPSFFARLLNVLLCCKSADVNSHQH